MLFLRYAIEQTDTLMAILRPSVTSHSCSSAQHCIPARSLNRVAARLGEGGRQLTLCDPIMACEFSTSCKLLYSVPTIDVASIMCTAGSTQRTASVRPSVRPSVFLLSSNGRRRVCCRALCEQEISIDSCGRAAGALLQAPTLSSKCG